MSSSTEYVIAKLASGHTAEYVGKLLQTQYGFHPVAATRLVEKIITDLKRVLALDA
jgi:hypothetical protein